MHSSFSQNQAEGAISKERNADISSSKPFFECCITSRLLLICLLFNFIHSLCCMRFHISDVQDQITCHSAVSNGTCGNSQNSVKSYLEINATNFVISECDIPLPPSSQVTVLKV